MRKNKPIEVSAPNQARLPYQVLTRRELNRATLSRQLLLERADLDALQAIEKLVGLQAQINNPPYIGLWTRQQNFQREELNNLMEQRRVIRTAFIRSTLHLINANDYLQFRLALQPALVRALQAFFGPRAKNLDNEKLIATAKAFLTEQPRTMVELKAKLLEVEPGRDPEALAYLVRTFLPLVQTPPGGFWGVGGSPAYALGDVWLGGSLAAEDLRTLFFRYLAAFGPASIKDFQVWSGLIKMNTELEQFKAELKIYKDEQGGELYDLPDTALPSPDVTAPVRFLPEYDNLILSHADRSRFVPDAYRKLIFLSAGRVRSTFLVDGFTAGTWKVEKTGKSATLLLEPFEPIPASVLPALLEEGELLLRFIENNADEYQVRY